MEGERLTSKNCTEPGVCSQYNR